MKPFILLYSFILFSCSHVVSSGFDSYSKAIEISNGSYSTDCDYYRNRIMTVAVWNIGHFSNGSSTDSSITYSEDIETEYRDTIDSSCSNICAITEYSSLFSTYPKNVSAKDTIFSNFSHSYECEQFNYCCNALFSNYFITNVAYSKFDCNNGLFLSNGLYANDYYYISGELAISDLQVLIVVAHCAYDKENSFVTTNQYRELVDKFESYSHVIILGDFNNGFSTNQVDLFGDNGYCLANSYGDNHYSTYRPETAGNNEIDNIITKGFYIDNIRMIETELSDHNLLSCSLYI